MLFRSWDWATGNGEIGNNGVHYLDRCRWLLGQNGLPRRAMSLGGRFAFNDDGQTPNFRNMVKDFEQDHPGVDWKARLYELFPNQPARQGVRVAGLTKPFGKGGY